MKIFAAVAVALLVATGASAAFAADPMNEEQARAKAMNILMGDPYGSTPEQVTKNITEAKLIGDGKSACGEMAKPLWQFHVVVAKPVNKPDSPIDGYLAIDAVTGKMLCANLPMLD